jgi:hypothetical protein
VSLKNRNVQRKIQIVGGKRSRQQENQNFSRFFGSLAENLKLHARAEKFRDFYGFPAKGPKYRRQLPASRRKARFSGKRLSGGRQRRKSCRASIYPAILLCSLPTKAGSR